MQRKFLFYLLLICCVAHNSSAFGQNSFNYINPSAISPEFITPPIPAKGPAMEAEAQQVINLQKNADKAEIAEAEAEVHLNPELLMLDKTMTQEAYPKTYMLLDKVFADCEAINNNAKNYWHTPRPYDSDKRIKLLIPAANSSAYPSGHTACSRVLAETLGQVYPPNRQSWRHRADEIAVHRILGGVHWPHDIIGGRQMGLLIFGALQMSQGYQADMARARLEWVK